jgi:hypothetical protein
VPESGAVVVHFSAYHGLPCFGATLRLCTAFTAKVAFDSNLRICTEGEINETVKQQRYRSRRGYPSNSEQGLCCGPATVDG